MRGNHNVWGQVPETIADKTTAHDRNCIAKCELREPRERFASQYVREVWLDGMCIGMVTVRCYVQYHMPAGCTDWLYSANEWGEGDPHYALAILDLLQLQVTRRQPS